MIGYLEFLATHLNIPQGYEFAFDKLTAMISIQYHTEETLQKYKNAVKKLD